MDVILEAGSVARRRRDDIQESDVGDPLTDNTRLAVSGSDERLGDRLDDFKETFVVDRVMICTRVDESLLTRHRRDLGALALEFYPSHVSAA